MREFLRSVLVLALLGALNLCAADGGDSLIAEHALLSTVRLRLETPDGDCVVTDHGSAFGVDLSAFGLPRPRYLLTAAHMVLAKDGTLSHGTLRVEVNARCGASWQVCRVVAYDQKHDLSLLECPVEIVGLTSLCCEPVEVGSPVVIAGSPSGVPTQLSRGTLVAKQQPGRDLWTAKADHFWHGNSGGPVFDARSGAVIGVAVAGLQDATGDMARDTALFTPAAIVAAFLRGSLSRAGLTGTLAAH